MSTQRRVQVVFEAVLNNFTSNVREAARTTLEVGEAGRRVGRDVDFSEPTRSSGRFENSLRGIINRLRGVSQGGEEVSDSTDFTEPTNSAERLNSTLERTTGIMKKLASVYVAKQVMGFAKDKISENLQTFMGLETGMREVFTLLPNMSEEAFGNMTDDLKKFSVDMKTLPEEAIPALYSAISAGVDDSTVFDFLEIAKKASTGGVTDLETSVDVLTSVVNAYGEEVLNAKDASDLMFVAVRNGKTSFNELASNLYTVVPIAESAGVPFSNLTAAISTMTAKGTPTAQATTQIARSIEELSKEGTKASEVFNEMTGKTFRQFMAEGNNIQDAYKIMERGAKHLNISVNDLFGSVEAGNAVLGLTGKGTEKFTSDLKDMENAAGSTEAAYEKMNNTLKASIDGVRARMQVFAWDIAGQYASEVKEAVDGLNSTFDRLSEDGTMDRLGQSIGGIVAAIINQINNVLSNADKIIAVIDNIAYHIENNMGTIISVIKTVIGAFLGFKVISSVFSVIRTLIDVFGLLSEAMPFIISTVKTLWGFFATHPIGLVIVAVIALIIYLYNLSKEFDNLKDFGTYCLEALKLAFWYFGSVVWTVIAKILEFFEKLLGSIPLIGDAVRKMSDVAKGALQGFQNAIKDTGDYMNTLRNEAAKGIDMPINVSYNMPSAAQQQKALDMNNEAGNYFNEALKYPAGSAKHNELMNKARTAVSARDNYTDGLNKSNAKTSSSNISFPSPPNSIGNLKMPTLKNSNAKGSSSSKSKKVTIQDKINSVIDTNKDKVDMYESRADLSKSKEDSKGFKENLNHMLYEMKQQAKGLLGLQNKSQGKDKNIVETARNKLLVQIAKVAEDIKEGINQMVGEFNVPSELRKLTEYQYKVQNSQGVLTKQLVVSPDIRMYLTIEDTSKKGAEQIKQEISSMTNAIFAKDDLVSLFTRDVTRN